MKILSLNCGSSSVKYQLFDWKAKNILAKGVVERVTIGNSFCVHEPFNKEKVIIKYDCPTHKEAVKLIVDTLTNKDYGALEKISDIAAVGHRVVHGGEKFIKSVVINDECIRIFEELSDLAPLHNPPNITGIKAAMDVLPNVPHVAVMDTAWHQTMPEHSYIYALPYEWYEKYKIRRYGFHGTSFLYVAKRAAVLLGKDPFTCNLVICHIGNGVSLNAVKNGVSYDTSMGFTPLEGLIMGTRAGDHDPSIDFYVMEKEKLSISQIQGILNKKSGLLGITGKYTDRRDVIEASKNNDKKAGLAIEMEAYRLKKYIGAYAAALGKVDALIFTAGVGELSDLIRAKAMDGLDNLGIKYDKRKNSVSKTRNAETDITALDSKTKVFVIPTDEELVFTEDVVAILEQKYDVHTNFTYSFQNKNYRNAMRDKQFQKECEINPELKTIAAKIN